MELTGKAGPPDLSGRSAGLETMTVIDIGKGR